MKIGMVGGIGPESTADYYQRLIRRYRETVDPDGYPQLVIDSIDMTAMLDIVADGDWDSLVDMLLGSVKALRKAGREARFSRVQHAPCRVRPRAERQPHPAGEHCGVAGAERGAAAGHPKGRAAGHGLHHEQRLLCRRV